MSMAVMFLLIAPVIVSIVWFCHFCLDCQFSGILKNTSTGVASALHDGASYFPFPTIDVCQARWHGSGKALVMHVKMATLLNSLFACLKFSFRLTTVSNKIIIIIFVQWCSM